MSNPNPYNLRGNSNAEMQAQIKAMQAQAEWKQIVEDGERTGAPLLGRANSIMAANRSAMGDIPEDAKTLLVALLRKAGQVLGKATNLRLGVLPTPVDLEQLAQSPYQRQRAYNAVTIEQAFVSMTTIAANGLDGADATINQILELVYAGVAPAQPPLARQSDVDQAAQVIQSALQGAGYTQASTVCQNILRQALQDNNVLALHVLLGARSSLILSAYNVNKGALMRTYANSQMAKAALDENGVAKQDSVKVPGARFLAVQGTDDRLSNLPAAVDAYWRAQLASAKALANSSTVQANTR